MAQASRILGISRASLSDYKRAGCPAFKSNGRVHLGELEAWLEINGKRTAGDSEQIKAARLRVLEATAAGLERENARKSGLLVNRDEVRGGLQGFMATLFAELDRLFCNELPPAQKGLDELGMKERATHAIDELRDTLHAKLAALIGGQ